MSNFTENYTKVGGLTSNDILPSREKIKIRFALKDRIEGLVFIFINVFYCSNSLSNFVSLGLLNNAGIYYHNEDLILYDLKTQKTVTFAKQYKTSFFLYLLNLSVATVNFLKNSKVYKEEETVINQTKKKSCPLSADTNVLVI